MAVGSARRVQEKSYRSRSMSEKKQTVVVEKRLYNRAEAAASLGVCQKTLKRLEQRGLLTPTKRVLRSILYSAAELDRFVAAQVAI